MGQKFRGEVTYFVKFVKTYFDRGRFFNFNIICLIFFQFFKINFLTIVNAIYILYVAKIGVKLIRFYLSLMSRRTLLRLFFQLFLEPQIISKPMFLKETLQ